MNDEPLVDEDEEEQKQDDPHGWKSARRIFGAGQRSVADPDNFTGSFRGVAAPKRGGPAYVKPEETLGDDEHCWCGQPAGHDWAGKAGGAPHPRTEKGSIMASPARSNAQAAPARLDMRQLRKFDDRVARMMTDLVNTYGVPFRIQRNGVHVLLYPLNNAFDGRPHKVGAARGAEQSMKHLEEWVKEAVTPALVASQAEMLAARFNDPTKVRRMRRAEAPEDAASEAPQQAQETSSPEVDQEPTVEPEAAQIEIPEGYDVFPEGVDPTPPEGYVRAVSTRGDAINWWMKEDRSHFICMWRDYETDQLQHSAAHMRKHSMTAEEKAAAARLGNQGRVANRRAQAATEALRTLAEIAGVTITTGEVKAPDTSKLEAEVERLRTALGKAEERLVKAVSDRDEALARVALIKEAMRA